MHNCRIYVITCLLYGECLPKSLNQNENDSLKLYQRNESEATTFDNTTSQHSSTPLLPQEEDNKVEGFAASSFIMYSGYFPEFLPNSAIDISSIDSDLELTVDRSSAGSKNDPQYYLPSEAHSRRVSETCYHNVNKVVQLMPTCLISYSSKPKV